MPVISIGESINLTIKYETYNMLDDKRHTDAFALDYIGWVGFMGSFNGRFFDGGYSGHSVGGKCGQRDYISEQIRNTLSQVENLKEVDFVWSDYKKLYIPDKSIIYCDPPYKGVDRKSTRLNSSH